MKRSWLAPGLCACIMLLAALNCFAQQTYSFKLPESNEPIYGAWVNPDNGGTYWRDAQKWVFMNWGLGRLFEKVSDDQPMKDFTFILVEKRVDPDGTTWYKAYQQFAIGHFSLTARVSSDSNVMEMMLAGGFLNESELNPKSTKGAYYVFRRE